MGIQHDSTVTVCDGGRHLPDNGGAIDFAEFKASHPGERFPVAVAIGADPATTLAAVVFRPYSWLTKSEASWQKPTRVGTAHSINPKLSLCSY